MNNLKDDLHQVTFYLAKLPVPIGGEMIHKTPRCKSHLKANTLLTEVYGVFEGHEMMVFEVKFHAQQMLVCY
jgi:hypothetical protein